MDWNGSIGVSAVLLLGGAASAQERVPTLLEARAGFETQLLRTERHEEPLDEPPEELFSVVQVPTALGDMGAYLGRPPSPEGKHPAMLWITGGFPAGGIGSSAWERQPSDNDQSAKAYREAGMVMMYPTLRGTFGNPGAVEGFLGEVDDVLAAAEFLARVDYVDPERIYLGGHSTGGTLALLAAAATSRFRAVVAFGPVEDPRGYGSGNLPFDTDDEDEARLRSPIHFLDAISCPTFVIEGTVAPGNLDSLRALESASSNSRLRFLPIADVDHFELLAPVNARIAEEIVALGEGAELELRVEDLEAAIRAEADAVREAYDLEVLSGARLSRVDFDTPRATDHYLVSRAKRPLQAAAESAREGGFEALPIEAFDDSDGREYFILTIVKDVILRDLDAVFALSAAVARIESEHGVHYNGWSVE